MIGTNKGLQVFLGEKIPRMWDYAKKEHLKEGKFYAEAGMLVG